MKYTRILFTLAFTGFVLSATAQVPIDPTGKRFMTPRERTKFGGPTPNTHKMPSGPENINITFIEIQIDPMDKGGIQITARGTKSPKIRGCDDCTIAGRVILTGEAIKTVPSVGSGESLKVKQDRNPGASRLISFKSESGQEYSVVTNPEGSFMMSIIPNGVYSIWVGGKKVITDFVLKTVEPSAEDLKKEAELKKQLEERKKAAVPPVKEDTDK